MYEFWYECINHKYGHNVRLCYTDTGSFISHAKTGDFYEDIYDDVEKWCDTSNYECDRPLPKGKKQERNLKNER